MADSKIPFLYSVGKPAGFADVPDAFFENHRIVPPYDSTAIRNYFTRIADELIEHPDFAGLDKSKIRPRILLSDDKEQLGFIVPGFSPPVMVLGKRLINEYAPTKDRLAGVIFHEMAHPEFRRRFGIALDKVTVVDEGAADYLAANWMVDLGYNWKEFEGFFRSFLKDKRPTSSPLSDIADFFDEHPADENRIKSLHLGIGARSLKSGEIIPEPTPTLHPATIAEMLKGRHVGYIEALKGHYDFEKLDTRGQLRLMLDHFPPARDPSGDGSSMWCKARHSDYFNAVADLSNAGDVPVGKTEAAAMREMAHEMVDRALGDNGTSLELFYHLGLRLIDSKHTEAFFMQLSPHLAEPLGRFREIDTHLGTFINAADAQAAGTAADAAMASVRTLHSEIAMKTAEIETEFGTMDPVTFLRSIHYPGFPEPGQAPNPGDTPWEKHLEWMRETGNQNIAAALWQMGVTRDERIWHLATTDTLHRLSAASCLLGELRNTKLGEFCFTRDLSEPMLNARFRSYLELRDIADRPAVSIDELAQNMQAYFQKNKALVMAPGWVLHPEFNPYRNMGLQKAWGTHFENAAEVTRRLEGMLTSGNANQREAARNFFLGIKKDPSDITLVDITSSARPARYEHESPYIKFLTRNPGGFLTAVEKIEALSSLHLRDLSLDWWRQNCGYSAPNTLPELARLLGPLEHKRVIGLGEIGEFFGDWNETRKLDPFGASAAAVIRYLGNEHTLSYPEPARFSRLKFNEVFKDALWNGEAEPENAHLRVPAGLSTRLLVFYYKYIGQQGLFPNSLEREKMGGLLFDKIAAKTDVRERMHYVAELFYSPRPKKKGDDEEENAPEEKETMASETVRDLGLREKLVNLWCRDVIERIGVDDGSAGYERKIMGLLRGFKTHVSPRDYLDFASALADAVVAQRKLAYAIRDTLAPTSEDLHEAHMPIKGIEALYSFLGQNPRERLATLDFLTAPLNGDSVEHLAELYETAAYRGKRHMTNALEELIGSRKNSRFNEVITEYIEPHVRKAKLRMVLADMHRYYWAHPLEIRALLTDSLLVPANAFVKDANKAYESATTLVSGRLFPEIDAEADPEVARRNRWSRAFVRSFVNNSQDAEKGLVIAGVMSAAERSVEEQRQARIGKRLASLCENTGSAFIKTGQQVHSHPAVPDDIRGDFAHIKSMAAKPKRWELFERMDEAVPVEILAQYKHFGEIKGCASFCITVEGEKWDGRKKMLGLLRKNARQNADQGFHKQEACVADLAAAEPDLGGIAPTVVEMIRQGREMAVVETDMKLAARQREIAENQYAGLRVQVGARTFNFRTAAWDSYGPEFREMDAIEGRHFNDLPESTPEELSYKRDFAKAYLAVEFLNILRGGEFDCDRHGAQLRVEGEDAGLFDHGGMTLRKPMRREKQQLARTLSAAFLQGNAGHDYAEVFLGEVKRLNEEENQRPDYLMKVQRALLALNDFIRYVPAGEMGAILEAVAATGEIDSTIKTSILTSMGTRALFGGIFKRASGRAESGSMSIRRLPHVSSQEPKFYESPGSAHEKGRGGVRPTPDDPVELMLWLDIEISPHAKRLAAKAIVAPLTPDKEALQFYLVC